MPEETRRGVGRGIEGLGDWGIEGLGEYDGCEIRRYIHRFGRHLWVGEYDGCEIRRYMHGFGRNG
jgi:hypothetical protein